MGISEIPGFFAPKLSYPGDPQLAENPSFYRGANCLQNRGFKPYR